MESVTPASGEVQEFQGRGLETYKTWFREAEDAHDTPRRLAHRDRQWYDNFDDDQWDEAEKRVLRARGQPVVTSNRIKRKVNFLCGIEQKMRSDPAAFPRSPQHEQAADIATKVLTFIEDRTRFDKVSSRCFKDLAIEGIGAAEVIVEDGEVVINKIDYDKFFYDPRSIEEDFSDARYLGYQDWFDVEDAVLMFPDAEDALHGTIEGALYDEGYEDKPIAHWGNAERRRVRIAVMYWRDARGVWNYTYFTGAGVLREGVSRYLDEDGKPSCCIIAASAYVTRDNERYGVVRDMISPQSEMNYRKSMALFLLKNRRMWSQAGVFDDNSQNSKEEVARADGHLRANGVYGQDWGFIDSSQEISGNFELLQEAKSEIDAQGPTAALQGRGTEQQSGRAIALQQNAGLAEENTLFDTHNDWKLRIYRAMWARAKQYWTSERAVRVTDDEKSVQFLMVNQPMVDPMTGMPMVDPMTGQSAIDPRTAIAKMDVDIVIEAAPDMITLQHEEFQQLAQLAGNGVPIPPDVLIEASQIRDKQELLERLKQETGAQGQLAQAQELIKQLQGQLQQMQKQMQQQGGGIDPLDQARAAEIAAKIEKMGRDAQREDARARADIEAKRAGTAQTVKQILTPAQPV